jgi:hypothetical protein
LSELDFEPCGFVSHTFEMTIFTEDPDSFWAKLNLRQTFVNAQFFPYKVEFNSPTQTGRFKTGELNIHHGPLLSVHGEIGDITEDYRDLKYYYGSYIFSFRLIRPTRLEFFKKDKGIGIKLSCYIRPWFIKIWELGNNFFWKRFNVLK